MLSDNPKGWDGVRNGKEVQREGTYVYLWLIRVDVWQKPTQYCKAIILQLKINNIYSVYLLAAPGLHCCMRAFSSCRDWGSSPVLSCRAQAQQF